MKTYTHSFAVRATPQQVYETLMQSDKHTALTGATAVISPEVGGSFTAWDGYVTGTNVELKEYSTIVQEWRGDEEGWPEGEMSTLSISLAPLDSGTKIDVVQKEVPDAAFDNIAKGWEEYYWAPLKEQFGELK